MAGLWETLPVSPCSAASDDPTARAVSKHHPVSLGPPSKSQVLLNTLPAAASNTSSRSAMPVSSHCVPSSPPVAKRARVESPRTTRPMSLDLDKPESPDTVADLPTRDSEEELVEKRRMLLEKLRIIKESKAKLVSSPSQDDEVTVVHETIAPPRAQPRRPSGKKASKAVRTANDVIDLEQPSLNIASLAPKKTATKRKYSAARGPATKSIDLDLVEMSKRKSSRVRRPRTPNLLDDKPSKTGPIPTCMTKCKRVQFCKKLIMSMLRDENSKPFSAPVKELWHEQAIPKYFEIISNPMDLGTVKRNLETTKYIRPVSGQALPYELDVAHFADDVRLVFRNAMIYNRAGDFIHNSARSLMEEFEKELETLPPLPRPESAARPAPKKKSAAPSRASDKALDAPRPRPKKSTDPVRSSGSLKAKKVRETRAVEVSGDGDLDAMSMKELRDRLRYLQRCRVPVLARTPVPKGSGYLTKAALLYPVEMSWQERKKCMEFVNKVPQSKTESFVDMVKKTSNMSSSDDSDEFELDFDHLDNKSMRNIEAFLEQYVPGFKTIRSSTVGREFGTVDLVESEMQRVRQRLSALQAESKKELSRSGTNAAASKSFFGQGEAQDSSSDSSDSSSDDDDSDSSDDESGEDSD